MEDDPILESKQGWKRLADMSDAEKGTEKKTQKNDWPIIAILVGGAAYIIASITFQATRQ